MADSDELVIRTNNVPRDIIDGFFLSPKEREEFDYIKWDDIEAGNDSASFFKYKGQLYDLGDCECKTSISDQFPGWDGYYSQTFFSGVLVKYAPDTDFEQVIVGNYYC